MLGDSMVVSTIAVTDLDRSKRFYQETLGLKFLWENPASVRFGCGHGTELSIFRRGPSSADHTLSHFEVSDLESVVRGLEERGVAFIDYADGPLQTTAHIAQMGPARGRGSTTRTAMSWACGRAELRVRRWRSCAWSLATGSRSGLPGTSSTSRPLPKRRRVSWPIHATTSLWPTKATSRWASSRASRRPTRTRARRCSSTSSPSPEAHRRRGIGRALVASLAEIATAAGCYGMWVGTAPSNVAAQATYTRAGASREEDAVIMSWRFAPS